MDSPSQETYISTLITSASLRLFDIILRIIVNAIGLGKRTLALVSSESFVLGEVERSTDSSTIGLVAVKWPLLDCGKARDDSHQRRLTYLDSLVRENEKRYEQTWELLYVEDRVSHLREIVAMLRNDHHQSPKVSWRILLRPACLFTSRRI